MEIGTGIALIALVIVVGMLTRRRRAHTREMTATEQAPMAGRLHLGQVMILNDAIRSLQQAHPFTTDLRREVVQSLQRFHVVQTLFSDARINLHDVSDGNLKRMTDAIDAKLNLHRTSRIR